MRTFLYRPQRGSLSDSMDLVEEMNIDGLVARMESLYGKGEVELKPYGYDGRIGWDTCLVVYDGMAVGFTNGGCDENL